MSVNGIDGTMGYNPYVVMNTAQQSQSTQMQKPSGQPPALEEAFSRANADGDEYISSSEMASMLSMGQSDELSEEGLAMYAEADIDGDGQLNENEFNTQMEKMAEQATPPPMNGQMPSGGMPGVNSTDETDATLTANLSQVLSLVGNASSSGTGSASSSTQAAPEDSSDEDEELTAMEILANKLADARDLDGDGEVSSSESAEYAEENQESQSSGNTQTAQVADPDKLSKTGIYQAISDMTSESDVVESQTMYA